MPSMDADVVILGGGLAGLSAALELSAAGKRVVLFERERDPGGLARSFEKDGFTCDLGPHRLLVDEPEAERLSEIIGKPLRRLDRRSRIYLEGRFFDYPLRVGNAIFSMPPLTTARILRDYAIARAKGLLRPSEDRNFEQWVSSRFGRTLYRIFFEQYTEKAWGIPCREISADWAAQRISLLNLWDAVWQAIRPGGSSRRTYASSFWYPVRGGIGELSRAMALEIERHGGKVVLGARVDSIEMDGDHVGWVRVADRRYAARHVISTVPITDLIAMTKPSPPDAVRSSAQALEFRAIVFIYLFLDRPPLARDHWIYLPEQRFIANRITEPANFGPENVPTGKTAVCAEITCAAGDKTWNTTDDVLAEKVMEDLGRLGWTDVRPSQVIGVAARRVREAYPVYRVGYRQKLGSVLGWLEQVPNLLCIGRCALFRYNNMDHSIEMGRRAAAVLLQDKPRRWAAEVATGSNYFG